MLTIIALTMTMVISLSVSLFSTKEQVYADSVEIPVSEFNGKEEFLLGDVLVLKESITIGDLVYTDGVVVLPDSENTVIKASQLQLAIIGNYVVRYYYTASNGNVTVAERVIPVKENAYTLSESNGSVVYASKQSQLKIKQDSFADAYGGYKDINTNTTRTLQDALIVRLGEDNEFKYSEPIDLRNVDENGLSDIITFQPMNADIEYDDNYNHRKYVQEEFMQNVIVPKLGYQSILTEKIDGVNVSSLDGRVYPELTYEKDDPEYGGTASSPYEQFKYYLKMDNNTYANFKFKTLDNVYKNKETGEFVTAKYLQDLYKAMDEENFAQNPNAKIADLNAIKYAHFRANFVADENALTAYLDYNFPAWPEGENIYGSLHHIVSRVVDTSNSVYFSSKNQLKNKGRINRVIVIKLTDAHDKNKYVEIKASLTESGGTTFTAAATSQKFYGLQAVSYHEYEWTGDIKMQTIDHVDNKDASTSNIYRRWDGLNRGTSGYLGLSEYRTGTAKLQYDLETNSLYLRTTTLDNNGVQGDFSKSPTLINAFSSEGVYDKSALFSGFTTGEVYLSIKMEEFDKDMQSRIDLISIGNKSGSDLVAVNSDGNQFYTDNIAPQLAIDIDETDEYGVYAPVGKDFVLPSARVYDLNLKGSYAINVYSWYNTPQQRIVPVVNGKFKVEENTIYTAIYTAVDNFGNVTTRSFDIVAKKTQEDYFAINHGLAGVTLEQGQEYVLPAWTITTLNNVKKLGLKITVTHEKESFAIDLNNAKFTPNYYGEYKVIYECSDNLISNYEYVVSLNCEHSTAIVYSDQLSLPRYFASNRYYSFDRIYANTYLGDAPLANIAEFYVSFDGGEWVKRNATRFFVDAKETVQVKYVFNGEELISDLIPVVDVGYNAIIKNNKPADDIYLKNYFVGDFEVDDYKKDADGNVLTNSSGKPVANADFIMKSTVSSGNNAFKFINELDLDLFQIKYIIPQAYSQYDELNFYLTDARNTANSLLINLSFGQETIAGIGGRDPVTKNYVYVRFNGELMGKYESVLIGMDTTISYDRAKKQVVITGGGKTLNVPYDFSYFTSKAINFDIELVGIYGKFSGIHVKEMCSESLLNQKHTDTVSPKIVLDKASGNYNIGTTIKLASPRFMDLLSGINVSSIYFTATFNDQPVQSVDGVTLDGTQDWRKDYEIKLSSVGNFMFTYYCEDNLGNKYNDSYTATVLDSEAPVITIQNDYNENTVVYVNAGEEFEFEYAVEDDSEATHYVTIYRDKSVTQVHFNAGNKFTLIDKGIYTIKIVAADAVGNLAVKSFKIEVR